MRGGSPSRSVSRRAAGPMHRTPLLILDPREAVAVAHEFYSRVGSVHYVVKAGPYESVVSALAHEDHGFDVASVDEIRLVLPCSDPSRIVCSNPAMGLREIDGALALGLRLFVTDAPEHTAQLHAAAHAQGIVASDLSVPVRLSLSDDSVRLNLSGKFGVPLEDAIRRKGLALGVLNEPQVPDYITRVSSRGTFVRSPRQLDVPNRGDHPGVFHCPVSLEGAERATCRTRSVHVQMVGGPPTNSSPQRARDCGRNGAQDRKSR